MWAIACVPAAVKLAYYPCYPGSDDAFIHLTLVRNIANGLGWGIQPGDIVNLSSSPLFTLLLTILHRAGLEGIAVGQALSLLFAWGSIVVLHQAAASVLFSQPLRLVVVLLAAFQPHLWRWSGVVMETSMACLAAAICLWLHLRLGHARIQEPGPWFILGLATGLAALTRPELALLMPCLGLDLAMAWRGGRAKPSLSLFTGFSLVLLAWSAFAVNYFGSVVPTTFHAKTSGLHLWNPTVLIQVGSVAASGSGVALLLGAACLLVLVRGGCSSHLAVRGRLLLLAAFPLLLLGFYYLKTDGLQSPGRYYLPALHVLPLCLAAVLEPARRRLAGPTAAALVLAATVMHTATSLYVNHVRVAPVLAAFENNYWAAMRGAASELARLCRPGEVVLVEQDIGVISYEPHGACRIADGGALASPGLLGLPVSAKVEISRADYVLESLGREGSQLMKGVPFARPLRSWAFASHSVGEPRSAFHCTLYSVAVGGEAPAPDGFGRIPGPP